AQRLGFFLVSEPDNDQAADQDGQQHQADGDLEVAWNHGRAPICPRTCAIADAIAAVMPALCFALSRDCRSAPSGASSTAIAGTAMLFRGRIGIPSVATVTPFLRSSAATALPATLLFCSEALWALSQERKRPAGGCGSVSNPV